MTLSQQAYDMFGVVVFGVLALLALAHVVHLACLAGRQALTWPPPRGGAMSGQRRNGGPC